MLGEEEFKEMERAKKAQEEQQLHDDLAFKLISSFPELELHTAVQYLSQENWNYQVVYNNLYA